MCRCHQPRRFTAIHHRHPASLSLRTTSFPKLRRKPGRRGTEADAHALLTIACPARLGLLEPFPFRLKSERGSSFCFDAFSSREPVPTSLEDRKSTRLNSSHSQISYAV